MLCLATAARVQRVQAADASAESLKVNAGSVVKITGVGFRHDERILTWASSSSPSGLTYQTGNFFANDDGSVTLMIAVKRFWEPTWWAVTLHGQTSEREAIARFEVVSTPPNGVLDVDPAQAPRGTRVRFHGEGFAAHEGIRVWATSPSGVATAVTHDVEHHGGELFFSFDVPTDARTGPWYMTAYGIDTDRLLVAPFEVIP
jgi:hypothetical protein